MSIINDVFDETIDLTTYLKDSGKIYSRLETLLEKQVELLSNTKKDTSLQVLEQYIKSLVTETKKNATAGVNSENFTKLLAKVEQALTAMSTYADVGKDDSFKESFNALKGSLKEVSTSTLNTAEAINSLYSSMEDDKKAPEYGTSPFIYKNPKIAPKTQSLEHKFSVGIMGVEKAYTVASAKMSTLFSQGTEQSQRALTGVSSTLKNIYNYTKKSDTLQKKTQEIEDERERTWKVKFLDSLKDIKNSSKEKGKGLLDSLKGLLPGAGMLKGLGGLPKLGKVGKVAKVGGGLLGGLGLGMSMYDVTGKKGQTFFGQGKGEGGILDSRASNYATGALSGAAIGAMFGPIGIAVGGVLGAGAVAIADNKDDIVKLTKEYGKKAIAYGTTAVSTLTTGAQTLWDKLTTDNTSINDTISTSSAKLQGNIATTFDSLSTAVSGIASYTAQVSSTFGSWVSDKLNSLNNAISSSTGVNVKQIASDGWNTLKNVGSALFSGDVKGAVRAGISGVSTTVANIGTSVSNSSLGQGYQGKSDGSAMGSVGSAVSSVSSAVNTGVGVVSEGVGAAVNMGSQTVNSILDSVSSKFGVDRNLFHGMAQIESGKNPNAANKLGFKGLFQFGRPAWADYGEGSFEQNVFNPQKNSEAAAKMINANTKFLKKNGIPVNATTIYLAHQQGPGGVRGLWNDLSKGIPNKYAYQYKQNWPAEAGPYTGRAIDFYNGWVKRVTAKAGGSSVGKAVKSAVSSVASSPVGQFVGQAVKDAGNAVGAGVSTYKTTGSVMSGIQSAGSSFAGSSTGQAVSSNIASVGAALSKTYDNLTYKMGSKNLSAGSIDCSGWAYQVSKKEMELANQAHGNVFSAKDIAALNNGAVEQIAYLAKKNGIVTMARNGQKLDLSKVKAGMSIGLLSKTSSYKGRSASIGGITQFLNHIVKVTQDPTSGKLLVSESQGGSGVMTTPLEKWADKQASKKNDMIVVDPLAKIRQDVDTASSVAQGTAQNAEAMTTITSGSSVMPTGSTPAKPSTPTLNWKAFASVLPWEAKQAMAAGNVKGATGSTATGSSLPGATGSTAISKVLPSAVPQRAESKDNTVTVNMPTPEKTQLPSNKEVTRKLNIDDIMTFVMDQGLLMLNTHDIFANA